MTLKVNQIVNEISGNPLRVIIEKTGTQDQPIVITNADGKTVIGQQGSGNGTHCVGSWIDPGYVKVVGKSEDEPLVLAYNTSGVCLKAKEIYISNVVIKDIRFAGTLLNWNGYSYKKIVIDNVRVFGAPNEGEAFYSGDTDKGASAINDELIMTNCTGFNKGRDGIQINNWRKFTVSNCTIHNFGLMNQPGQQAGIQVQNAAGVIKDTIIDGVPTAFNLATHDLLVKNCYIRYGGNESYAGDAGVWSTLAYTKGNPVVFEDCTIVSEKPVSHFIKWATSGCEIVFRNCKLYNIEKVAMRVSGSGEVKDEGCIFLTGFPEAPKYVSTEWDDFKNHMRSQFKIGYKPVIKTYEDGYAEGYIIGRADQYAEDKIKIQNIINGF